MPNITVNLDMSGPYKLDTTTIYDVVTRIKPGNYALGFADANGFTIHYVGRSDSNVATRLLSHVTEPYTHFKFSYASNPVEAFKKECKNYHDCGGSANLDNEYHPDKPNGYNVSCPYC